MPVLVVWTVFDDIEALLIVLLVVAALAFVMLVLLYREARLMRKDVADIALFSEPPDDDAVSSADEGQPSPAYR